MAKLGAPIPANSPAVNFREIDLTGRVGDVPSSVSAIAGNFAWGPVGVPTLVADETTLVRRFGQPNSVNTIDFHSAAMFHKYSDTLNVIRELDGDSAGTTPARNAYAITSPSAALLVKNDADFDLQVATLDNFAGDSAGDPLFVRGHSVIAAYPGALANGLEVSVCPGDSDGTVFAAWEFADQFDAAPGTSSYASNRDGSWDEIHVVVVDRDGKVSGTKNTILERYPYVSVAFDGKTADGATSYVKNVINNQSSYIKFVSFGSSLAFDSDAWGLSSTLGTSTTPGTPKTFTDGLAVKTWTLAAGVDGTTLQAADYIRAFATVDDIETTDVDILIAPGMTSRADQDLVCEYMLTIAKDIRKDCVVVTSPNRSAIVNQIPANIVDRCVEFANGMSNSSYLIIDAQYVKVYDKYRDEYIFIPAASSVAGLMAASEKLFGAWYSPAGRRRGVLRGIDDIAWNPRLSQRDTLYKAGMNPIIQQTGQDVQLFGDKTKLQRPSAFDRINVRRLFLKLEKDIVRYAHNILFEFNDEFTRAEFVGVVDPYLRDVLARRGIYDYTIVCDETNNTPEVIDNNQFVASIFVKPARSINFITLNFVAVRTGASFEEVVGLV